MKEENIQMPPEKEKDLIEMLRENLEINREILQSVRFIKKYFHWRAMWKIVKVVILVSVVVFGVISFKTAVEYFQGYTSNLETYSEKLNQLKSLKTLVDLQKR